MRARHLGPERRRPQVLDAALSIAAEHGIGAITMGAIARQMGVSRPVVYDCYGGRGDVLAALLARESEVALSRLLAILPPLRTSSVEQMFVDGFASLLGDVRQRPASWRIITAGDPDPVLIEAIAAGRSAIIARVGEVMRPLLTRWQVPDLDRGLPVLTEIFVSMCETAVRLQLDAASGSDSPDVLAGIVGGAAYRALRARGGPEEKSETRPIRDAAGSE